MTEVAGDVGKDLGEVAEARRLYNEALAMASDPRDRDAAAERVHSINEQPEEQAEMWEALLRQRSKDQTSALPANGATPPPAQ